MLYLFYMVRTEQIGHINVIKDWSALCRLELEGEGEDGFILRVMKGGEEM